MVYRGELGFGSYHQSLPDEVRREESAVNSLVFPSSMQERTNGQFSIKLNGAEEVADMVKLPERRVLTEPSERFYYTGINTVVEGGSIRVCTEDRQDILLTPMNVGEVYKDYPNAVRGSLLLPRTEDNIRIVNRQREVMAYIGGGLLFMFQISKLLIDLNRRCGVSNFYLLDSLGEDGNEQQVRVGLTQGTHTLVFRDDFYDSFQLRASLDPVFESMRIENGLMVFGFKKPSPNGTEKSED